MSKTNIAIYVKADSTLEVRELPIPAPEEAQALVEVAYSGINPADTKHALLGIVDTVAGHDFSGTVVKAGPGSKFKKGDKVAGTNPTGVGRPITYGAHQNFLVALDIMTWTIPDSVPLQDAACLAVSVRTTADAFLNIFKYPLPLENSAGLKHTGILIWGGSSSLGFMTIQFTKAIGVYPILTTASKSNHAALQLLGATECFDYKDPDVISNIRAASKKYGGPLKDVFDAIGSFEPPTTADLAKACGAEDAIVLSATGVNGLPMPFATHEVSTNLIFPPGSGNVISFPASPEKAARAQQGFDWALQNYGTEFKIPTVEVVDLPAGEVAKYLEEKAAGGANFRKVCLKHTFQL